MEENCLYHCNKKMSDIFILAITPQKVKNFFNPKILWKRIQNSIVKW